MAGKKRPATSSPTGARPAKAAKSSKSPSKSPSPRQASPVKSSAVGANPRYYKIAGMEQRNGQDFRRIMPEADTLFSESIDFPSVDFPDSKGLVNGGGNDCYRNATLQGLFHVPAFYRYLGTIHKDCTTVTVNCLVCQLQHLCYRYWMLEGKKKKTLKTDLPEEKIYIVDEIVSQAFHRSMTLPNNLSTFTRDFGTDVQNNAQCDAREMLEYIVNEMIPKVLDPVEEIAYSDMFDVERKNTWTCEDCGKVSETMLQRQQLGVSVQMNMSHMRDGISLGWCLDNVFNTSTERSCTDATCREAARQGGADVSGPVRKISTKITRAPQILFVQLIRFRQTRNESTGRFDESKVMRRVKFPEILDLEKYSESGAVEKGVKYRLDAVVAHGGRAITGGHYIATCRNQSGDGFKVINDSHSIGMNYGGTWQDAYRPMAQGSEFQPAMLMYSRLPVPDADE